MKKSILLSTIVLVLLLSVTAFKTLDSDEKEYVTIYFNEYNKEVSTSSSTGVFKSIKFMKGQGIGDQTQLLKLIKDYEKQGFKLHQYSFGTAANLTITSVISVIMVK